MNLRAAILTVLRDADLRGASLAVLAPAVRELSVGEPWTRVEIERELALLQSESWVIQQLDRVRGERRFYISALGRVALISSDS